MVGNQNSGRGKNPFVNLKTFEEDDPCHKVFFSCNCFCFRYQNQYIIINDCKNEGCLRRKVYDKLKKNDITNKKTKIKKKV